MASCHRTSRRTRKVVYHPSVNKMTLSSMWICSCDRGVRPRKSTCMLIFGTPFVFWGDCTGVRNTCIMLLGIRCNVPYRLKNSTS